MAKNDAKIAEEPVDEVEASRAPLMDHLIELRTRLMHSLIAIGVLFCGMWFVTDTVLSFLLTPLGDAAHRAGRPLNELFVAQTTAPLEMLFVKLKLAFVMALAVGFPYVAYQVYAFVAPGLYKNERAAIMPFLFVMPPLFAAGAALVYYYVMPAFMDLSFSQELVGTNVKALYVPKVKEYYELIISLLMCFGFAFQLPVVMALLSMAGVLQASMLRKGRKYALLIIFVVAAVVTPPDPFSQFILGVPLYLLYESGIICAVVIERGRKRREAAEAKREEDEARREAAEEAARRAKAVAAATPPGTLPAGE
ncbi:MAG: twin-arginine translocase subunit TatC [Hyphomonadaceae bacterium]